MGLYEMNAQVIFRIQVDVQFNKAPDISAHDPKNWHGQDLAFDKLITIIITTVTIITIYKHSVTSSFTSPRI